MTVQTSNATFIHTDQIEQQFAITRLRALETGRWVVVASTNGVTGVIAPDGSVVASAEPRTQAALVERVGLDSSITPRCASVRGRDGSWRSPPSGSLTFRSSGPRMVGPGSGSGPRTADPEPPWRCRDDDGRRTRSR